MPATLLNNSTNQNGAATETSTTPTTTDPKECSKFQVFVCCGLTFLFAFFLVCFSIRHFTEVTPKEYFWPCNNTEIIPSSEIKILYSESLAYEKILKEFERLNTNERSPELKNIKAKKRDVEIKIKVQDCFRQKCAKINIQNNLETIKNEILSISIWLFRIAAILFLLIGVFCYYNKKCSLAGFGIFVLLFVCPIFVNAFLSLYDFYAIPKFKVKC